MRAIIVDYINKRISFKITDTAHAISYINHIYSVINDMFNDFMNDSDRNYVETRINLRANEFDIDARLIIIDSDEYCADSVDNYLEFLKSLELAED